jgi:hypothetical protein
MSAPIASQVFFALLVGAGLWLLGQGGMGVFLAQAARRQTKGRMQPGLKAKPDDEGARVSALPEMPLAQRLLSPLLIDLGLWLFSQQNHASVEERLRRSGWRYTSVGDFFGSKIALCVVWFAAAALFTTIIGLPSVSIVGLSAGCGVLGLFQPDWALHATLRERRESLFREMAWTVDRLAMVMSTGLQLGPALVRVTSDEYAWVSGGAGGLFIAMLRDLAAGLTSQRIDYDDVLDEIRRSLPTGLPELEEFLQIVHIHLVEKQPVVEQFRALGHTMREQLNNRIDELAQKSELKVVLITSGVILPMLMLVVGGPALIGFLRIFS